MADHVDLLGMTTLSYVCELALGLVENETKKASNVDAGDISSPPDFHDVPVPVPMGTLRTAVYTIVSKSKTPMYVEEIYKQIQQTR